MASCRALCQRVSSTIAFPLGQRLGSRANCCLSGLVGFHPLDAEKVPPPRSHQAVQFSPQVSVPRCRSSEVRGHFKANGIDDGFAITDILAADARHPEKLQSRGKLTAK